MEQQYQIQKQRQKQQKQLEKTMVHEQKEQMQIINDEQNNQENKINSPVQSQNDLNSGTLSQQELKNTQNNNSIKTKPNHIYQKQQKYSKYVNDNNNKKNKYENSHYVNMDDLQDEQLMEHSSIFTNKNIGIVPRIIIPVILILIFALFLSSDLTSIGVFGYQLHYGKHLQTEIKTLKGFSMFETVQEQWRAGIYPLAIMIILFSGVWPFMKIVGLFCVWFTSTKIVSYKSREKILVILDALGKWSFFDSIIMLILIDALHMHIDLPTPLLKTRIQLGMVADYGFFAFYSATMLSLLITHVEIYYHRQTINNDRVKKILESYSRKQSIVNQNVKMSFNKHSFNSQSKNECAQNNIQGHLTEIDNQTLISTNSENTQSQTEQQIYNEKIIQQKENKKEKESGIIIQDKKKRTIYTILLILCLILLVSGVLVKSVSFEVLGLVGYLLGPDQANQSYSIYDIGTHLPQNTVASFMIYLVQVVFYVTNLIIPVLFLLLLLILFLFPEKIKLKYQLNIFVWIEILYAWSSIDVVVVAIVLSIIEIKQFMLFLVGDSCIGINEVLEILDKQDILKLPGGPVCFDASTRLDIGCILLFGASFFFIILGTCILRSLQGNIDSKLHVDDVIRKQSEINQQNLSMLLEYNPNIVKGEVNKPLLM
ncbi:hypothetical protein PPERSA_06282 [Pseudocohnilembus persalinus]|uniref:Transmembrane protein n=1 Tax=Pseudocohnilembus persalinus TaxID=266149 RepID=A0A0V0QVM3_PSEPJ|nr:hypothetical protein PPERSA_06282 [Pseudocohnilembus persalinus]|eukprot:KRX06311.1 hypothetical protein PPERSA_06282 [Pseudocohnilembus persalinus]